MKQRRIKRASSAHARYEEEPVFSPAYVTRLGSKIPGIGPIGKDANFVFLLPGMVFFPPRRAKPI
jgi:hypothetical protein